MREWPTSSTIDGQELCKCVPRLGWSAFSSSRRRLRRMRRIPLWLYVSSDLMGNGAMTCKLAILRTMIPKPARFGQECHG